MTEHVDAERDEKPPKQKRDRTHWLYILVIIGVVAGIIVGLVSPGPRQIARRARRAVRQADQDDDHPGHLLHDGARHRQDQAAAVGKVGGLALGYFSACRRSRWPSDWSSATCISPGSRSQHPDRSGQGRRTGGKGASEGGPMEFFSAIIPTTLFSSLTWATCCRRFSSRCWSASPSRRWAARASRCCAASDCCRSWCSASWSMILWVAPIGAFGAIAEVVGATGFDAVKARGADARLLPHLRHLRVRCARRAAVVVAGCRSSSWCGTWPASTC